MMTIIIPRIGLGLLAALLCWAGCVSTQKDEDKLKAEKALETQKAIIANHLNRGDPEKAFAELRPVLQKFPDNVDLISMMGLTQLALRNPDNAIRNLEKAYKLEPSSTTILNLSSAYIEAGQNVKALKLLRNHVKTNENLEGYSYPERIYHNIGLAYANLKRKKMAMRFFNRALNENPKFYLSLMQLGDIHSADKKFTEARTFYRRALPACNQCFEALQALASSYSAAGNPAGAITVLKAYSENKQIPNDMRSRARQMAAKISTSQPNRATAKMVSPRPPQLPTPMTRTPGNAPQ